MLIIIIHDYKKEVSEIEEGSKVNLGFLYLEYC